MQNIMFTSDGSATLFNTEFNESYHSLSCGALKESYEKHVIPILNQIKHKNSQLRILDVCFGLGYNAFAALLYAKRLGLSIEIVSPEIDEALPRMLSGFNFPSEFDEIKPVISQLAKDGYAKFYNSSVKIVFGDFRQTTDTIDGVFDGVFQDPFSPKKNRSLWSLEYFCKLYDKMTDDGVLSTYSQSSAVRLTMQEAGFYVYDLPLAKPMRSGTIASKVKLNNYEPIDMDRKKSLNSSLEVIKD